MFLRFGLLVVAACGLAPAARADDPKPADLNSLRLYVPIPQLEDRFGADVVPLADYVKALQKRAGELLAEETRPPAKGLLIAVGIKSKQKTRVWCQPVEGEVPKDLVRRLEAE